MAPDRREQNVSAYLSEVVLQEYFSCILFHIFKKNQIWVSTMASREILIVGATGQQGLATIASLNTLPNLDPPLHILALTRSANSEKAQGIIRRFQGLNITLVEGDTRAPDSIFAAHPGISAVFLVTVPSDEENQAFPLIDAAVAPGRQVRHIVFSSVDRGGDEASWDNETCVPHFAAKHKIERHLRDKCEASQSGCGWTILRPTGFMDNYNPGFFGKMMASMWAVGLTADRPIQMVSVHDIGLFAAKSLTNPDSWRGRAVGLAGDEMTFDQADGVFQKVVGKPLPRTWDVIPKTILWTIEEARTSFKWFEEGGYGVDVKALREDEPRLQSFETWLRDTSKWKK